MKFVFVGPSLPDAADHAGPATVILPPAKQGDIMKVLAGGATAIGLIDGYFEYTAPVWHKEILFALKQGCQVLGAASMGALRASECDAYGMKGIGQIYDDYRSGRRVDDGDVALLHGPPELGYPAVSVALVNVDATLAKAVANGLLAQDNADVLAKRARSIFFKQRTWTRIADTTSVTSELIRQIATTCFVDQKRQDALALFKELNELADCRRELAVWDFNSTPIWRRLYGKMIN